MDDLKKCPFCGGEARYTYEMPYNYIVCMKCYAASPMINNAYKQRDGKEEAIKAWNRRADDGWIRVEDRLPDKPMRCFVYTKRGGRNGVWNLVLESRVLFKI